MKVECALKRLGYTQEWLDFDIISEAYLLAQYKDIQTSEDQNAEHFRSGGFGQYLNSKVSLMNEDIDQIFSLKDNGPDLCDLHIDRIMVLFTARILTHEQFEYIEKFPSVHEPPINKKYLRENLISRIHSLGVPACLEDIKETEDSAIHNYIIEHDALDYELIIWLKANGLNKRVRNMAKQLSNISRYRKRNEQT